MNNKHLFWIIPFFLLLGFVLGFEISFPKKITIDYGDNFIYAINMTDKITSKPIKMNIDPIVIINMTDGYLCMPEAEFRTAKACYTNSKLIETSINRGTP